MNFDVHLFLFIWKFDDVRFHSRRKGDGGDERGGDMVGTACTFSTKMNTLLSDMYLNSHGIFSHLYSFYCCLIKADNIS